MKISSLRAMLTATVLAATGAVMMLPALGADAPKDAPKEPPLTTAVAKLLIAAQTAAQKKDFAGALDDVHQAQAVANVTPFDTYKINQFLAFIAANTGDTAAAFAAETAAADSPALPDADKETINRNALMLSLNVKNYEKAAVYAKRLQDLGVTDDKSLSVIMQAYYMGGNYAASQAMAQKRVDATPAGQKPDRNTLQILLSSQAQQKNEADAEKTLEILVLDYNDPKDWTQMIDISFSSPGLRDLDAIYLGRLLLATGAPISASDANLIATTANHLTFYGDELAAVAKGATPVAGADAKAATDQKNMATQIANGTKPGAQFGGQYNVKLAEALYGYGRYPEAETAARAAIAKGGAADPSEPPMVLGMTLVAESKYSDAITAFGQVTGGGPATPRIVRLWKGFAQSKMAPTASASSAAPAAAPH